MASKYVPHNGYIVVSVPKQKKTAGGIALPGSYKQTGTVRGTVVAIGFPRVTSNGTPVETRLKVGDVVLYQRGTYVLDIEDDADQSIQAIEELTVVAIEIEGDAK